MNELIRLDKLEILKYLKYEVSQKKIFYKGNFLNFCFLVLLDSKGKGDGIEECFLNLFFYILSKYKIMEGKI